MRKEIKREIIETFIALTIAFIIIDSFAYLSICYVSWEWITLNQPFFRFVWVSEFIYIIFSSFKNWAKEIDE